MNYYSADDHRLHEIWWVPGEEGTVHIDLTAEVNEAPAREDRPAAFTVDGPNSLHVAYGGPGRHILELRRWWL